MSASPPTVAAMVEFCGIEYRLDGSTFVIGRDGDLTLDDDNLHLHRRFLSIERHADIWMLANTGTRLTATVSDDERRLEAFVAPGVVLPLVFAVNRIRFTAGPTSYELTIRLPDPVFGGEVDPATFDELTGDTTVGRVALTPDQLRLVLVLAEPALRRNGRVGSSMPTSSAAAARLGWTPTKFGRKLDNVCQKLAAKGIRGLHGEPGKLALHRKARLVEYAIAVGLVRFDDLALLDAE